jgi:signal transduction histidine kinase
MKHYKINHILFSLTLFFFSNSSFSQKTLKQWYEIAEKQFEKGSYADALISRQEALKIALKTNKCYDLAYAYWQIGKMQYYLNDRVGALKTNLLAKHYIDSCSIDTLKSIICNNIGAMYHSIGKIDSALVYYTKTIAVLSSTKRYIDIARVHSLLGKLYLNKVGNGNIEKAKLNFDKALEYADLSGDYSIRFFVRLAFTDYYNVTHDLPKATQFARTAYDLVYKNKGKVEEKIYVTRVLAQELTLAEKPEVKRLYDQFVNLRDSIFKLETSSKIADYKVQYETEKKEKENKLLQQQNNIKTLENDKSKQTIFILIACIIIAFIVLFWQLSLARIKKQKRLLETEKKLQNDRERISRDLHDNVGGQLSYVMFSLEANEENSSEKRKEKAITLANELRSITSNLRETIWALNQDRLNIQSISDKLKLYGQTLFTYSNTKLKFEETIEDNQDLNPAIALNIFRMCQEILNNILKHAKASEIKISFVKNKRLSITIADNGCGFLVDDNQNNGYGLKTLKARADEINATIEINSELTKGTRFQLLV